MAGHTLGPWQYHPTHGPFMVSSAGWDVARVCETVFAEEQEANARLIAQAPALLAMLREGAGAEGWDTEEWAHWQSDALTIIAEAS